MQRFGTTLRLIAATCSLSMLLGVQLFHSPFHHLHAIDAEAAAACPTVRELVKIAPACPHGHHHFWGHSHDNSPTPDRNGGDSQPAHDDCALCDLALAPATISTSALIESDLESFEYLSLIPHAVWVSAVDLPLSARGPPVA